VVLVIKRYVEVDADQDFFAFEIVIGKLRHNRILKKVNKKASGEAFIKLGIKRSLDKHSASEKLTR
jgi:hypothetical protein